MRLFNTLVEYCREGRSNQMECPEAVSNKPSMISRSIYGSSKLLDLSSIYQGTDSCQLNSGVSLDFSADGLSAISSNTDGSALDETLSMKSRQVATQKIVSHYPKKVSGCGVDLPHVELPVSRAIETYGPVTAKKMKSKHSGVKLSDVTLAIHQERNQQTYSDRRLSMRRLCIADLRKYASSGASEGSAVHRKDPNSLTDHSHRTRQHNLCNIDSSKSHSLTQLMQSTLTPKEREGLTSVILPPSAESSTRSGSSRAAVRKEVRFAAHPFVGTTHSSTIYDRKFLPDANQSSCMIDTYRELMIFKLTEMNIHDASLKNNNLHLAKMTSENRRKVCKILQSILAESQ